MCGIVGTVFCIPEIAERMNERLAHRGPDGQGLWKSHNGNVVLGHRRLAIIDTSSGGHQPMLSGDGRFVISFNGEIYNYQELRAMLKDVSLKSNSDTEILLETIARFGWSAALSKIRGMFAIAIFDRKTNTLNLAVDRMGEKPIYFTSANGKFAFASELKAFRKLPFFNAEIDRKSLTHLLRYNCIAAPRTIFTDTFKLSPGATLTVKIGSSGFELQHGQYWNLGDFLSSRVTDRLDLDDQQAITITERVLLDAVKRQMVADVPVGSLLSGGYDSTVITAMMQQLSDRPVKTFSIGMAEKGYDESASAAQVAKTLGTDHTNLVVSPNDAMALIEEVKHVYCEPFADASQIPTLLVSRLAKQHVTVALSGDGGDELFGGYNRHFWSPTIWNKIRRWPVWMRRATRNIVKMVPSHLMGSLLGLVSRSTARPQEKLEKLLRLIHVGSRRDFYRLLTSLEPEPKKYVINGTEENEAFESQLSLPANCGFSEHMMAWDTARYLPADILTKTDRASMAASLELRVPFLDLDLLSHAWRLPERFKIRNGDGKWVLKQIAHRHLPAEIMDRPKMGFSIPVDKWLRGPLRDWASDLLTPDRLERDGYFNSTLTQHLLKQHLDQRQRNGNQLWTLLMFQEWHDGWFTA